MRRRAFTLMEVMISSSIFVVMIGMVMAAVVAQSKFGISIGNYADMNAGSRKVLTQFDKDMRMATEVLLKSDTEVKVSMTDTVDWTTTPQPTPGTAKTLRYYVTDDKLYREITDNDTGAKTTTLALSGLKNCKFAYFDTNDALATSAGSVQKILLSGTLQKVFVDRTNTDYLVSAVVVLRSKPNARLQ